MCASVMSTVATAEVKWNVSNKTNLPKFEPDCTTLFRAYISDSVLYVVEDPQTKFPRNDYMPVNDGTGLKDAIIDYMRKHYNDTFVISEVEIKIVTSERLIGGGINTIAIDTFNCTGRSLYE